MQDWPSSDFDDSENRSTHAALKRIHASNVGELELAWFHELEAPRAVTGKVLIGHGGGGQLEMDRACSSRRNPDSSSSIICEKPSSPP